MKKDASPSTPRAPSKRTAAIYRKAAAAVEKGAAVSFCDLVERCKYGYACNAIEAVQDRDPFDMDRIESEATVAFKDFFSPGWATETGFFGDMEKQQNRDRRVLALCFMAAITERP